MNKIAIVYWSGTGNTEAMAKFVAAGAASAGGTVELFTPSEFSEDKVAAYDAIAFGCPSMGSEQLEDSKFEPMFDTVKAALGGKRIGLFGSYGWGDGEWMRNWAEDCAAQGCILAAEPVTCMDAPDPDAVQACRGLGETLAN